jgi:mRNA interferase RelE/StbE
LAWKIEYAPRAKKVLRKLDRQTTARILAALEDISMLASPRLRGHALTGPLADLWSYRVGDWRVLARIEDQRLVILVIEVGNRREIYRS